ncbi:MAG: hypothetical protein RSC43_07575 [Clostridia bacterium]
MKNKDTFELFEVFKPGYMDAPFMKKFAFWFKNVFWYHFKFQTLLVLFGLILVAIFVGDMVNRIDNDADFIMAGNTMATSEQMTALSDDFKALTPDINEDGKITVGYQMLSTSPDEGYEKIAQAMETKLGVVMADDRYLLFVLDKAHMEALAAQGAFEPLTTFGIASNNRFCVPVSDSAALKNANIPAAPGGWYAGIKVITDDRKKNENTMKKYDVAAELMKKLMVKE